MRWLKPKQAFLGLVASLVLSLMPMMATAATCSGRVMNPVTDVCWSCLFPMRFSGVSLSPDGVTDPVTDAPNLCTCQAAAGLVKPGFNVSFWEPVRTVELVREPYCLVSLGGVDMSDSAGVLSAPAHGRSASRSGSAASEGDTQGDMAQHTAFWQAHWYHTPWLFVLEAVMDTRCLEQSAWDLAYLTELDPIWADSLMSFILAPESAIFANPVAVAACALDCTAASLGVPSTELFWCQGCQGSLYPLAGWVASQHSALQAWHLLAARMSVKLAREGLLWAAYGKRGQCGPYFEPIPRKDVWRTQLIYPTVKASGDRCCQPMGAATQVWGVNATYPVNGEDGAILLWRMRDCCATQSLF